MSYDALIDALSGYIETGPDGAVRHYNSSGKLHRTDGPAVETARGQLQAWYRNGVCHRTEGPAKIYSIGYKEWFLNGQRMSSQEFSRRISAGDCLEP